MGGMAAWAGAGPCGLFCSESNSSVPFIGLRRSHHLLKKADALVLVRRSFDKVANVHLDTKTPAETIASVGLSAPGSFFHGFSSGAQPEGNHPSRLASSAPTESWGQFVASSEIPPRWQRGSIQLAEECGSRPDEGGHV